MAIMFSLKELLPSKATVKLLAMEITAGMELIRNRDCRNRRKRGGSLITNTLFGGNAGVTGGMGGTRMNGGNNIPGGNATELLFPPVWELPDLMAVLVVREEMRE